jgi:hypothetical protein
LISFIGCSTSFNKLTDDGRLPIILPRMNRMSRLLVLGLVLAAMSPGITGCASDPAPAAQAVSESIGMQLLRAVPSLKDERFSTLLDFESTDDAIFCSTAGGAGLVGSDRVHTGHSAYRIDSAATRVTVKLSSLLAGRAFPGAWTLAGGYFYADSPTTITVRFEPPMNGSDPHEVELPGGTWTSIFAELPRGVSPQAVPSLLFELQAPHGSIWFDDVMLIDNYKLLTAPSEVFSADPGGASATAADDVSAGVMPSWTVQRRGSAFIGSAPARFEFKLVTSQSSPSGWTLDEANSMRARFHSGTTPSGAGRTLTIYADGRAYWDGQYKPMSTAAREPTLEAQHESPAQIEVAEGMGRIDRNTAGDANNDGYNETTGSYRIIATGPRIELRFVPTRSAVLSPILEFSGLPFGKALVTLEGRLVEQSTRTSTGTLLVELPAKIDRPVTVNVRIEE